MNNKYNFDSYNTDSKNPPVVILHGWGGDLNSLKKFAFELSKQINNPVYSIELPGFGKTAMIKKTMDTTDYANFLSSFTSDNNLVNPIVVGHSFGGKTIISAVTSNIIKARQIVLINSSGLKPRNSIKKKFAGFITKVTPDKIKENKFLKNVIYKYILRERDYLNAGKLKTSLAKIVDEHYDQKLSDIKVSTLIVWGQNDSYVPLWMGEKFEREIKYSKLVVIPDETHGLPLKQPKLVAEIVGKWINQSVILT